MRYAKMERKWVLKPVKFNRKTLERLSIDYDYAINSKFLKTVNIKAGGWSWKNDSHTFLASVDLSKCSKIELVQLIGTITEAMERNFDNKPQMSFYMHDKDTAIIHIHLDAP